MEKIKKQKTFDAVKMMRDSKDKISEQTQDMTFEELKAYIKKQLTDSKTGLSDNMKGRLSEASLTFTVTHNFVD